MAKKVLNHNFSKSLDGATIVKVEIDPGDGNLMIDPLTTSERILASGTLQYLENNGLPIQSVNSSNGETTLTLRSSGKGQPWFRFPWSACNGATEWQIHLNPTVLFDIMTHSDGGNINLDLTGMTLTRVSADTGGGNMIVILPDHVAGLSVTAKTGAGNVVVELPAGMAARIHATSGLGKVILDPRFIQIDKSTYQSPDFDNVMDRVEITATSGAGNVSIKERTVQPEVATL